MEKPWYEEVKSDEDKLYEENINKIKDAVMKGSSFEDASKLIDIKDNVVLASILDDSLKVIIAQMHYVKKMPLKEVAKTIGVPLKRLEDAKKEMINDVEETAISAFKSKMGGQAMPDSDTTD